ncbi:hypothetical protein AVEN_227458-1 [Araneus ventricosus]|uniref:Uncharacterized protein n=1 Tax=Araneus ventricosus TaxID=182803 RepID=A0A4Y2A0A5_ARAVE|nr:hypothetical protein AVEN_4281-1 [Araneus ventricosus]GBL73179.1 hypothetical protein AVEN_227458-1 [Araneus ventricosus]
MRRAGGCPTLLGSVVGGAVEPRSLPMSYGLIQLVSDAAISQCIVVLLLDNRHVCVVLNVKLLKCSVGLLDLEAHIDGPGSILNLCMIYYEEDYNVVAQDSQPSSIQESLQSSEL